MAEAEALANPADQCRLAENMIILLLESLNYARPGYEPTAFVNDHYFGIMRLIATTRLPFLAIAAISEQDLSCVSEISDGVVAVGMKGFWSALCLGRIDRHSSMTFAAGILLNNLLATYIFNAVNHFMKQQYPEQADEHKRRLARAAATILGNCIVPFLIHCADSLDLLYFGDRHYAFMKDTIFWTSTLNHLVAEVAAYLIKPHVIA